MGESNLSQVSVPIKLKIAEIEKLINEQIDGVLYKNNELAGENADNLKIKAEKAEDISISFDGSHINYRVPLKIWIKKEIAFTAVEAEGAIALRFSTEYKIEKDWKLTTRTQVLDYDWLQKPHLRFGVLELPIKFIVNTILEKSKTLLCTTLDEELAKNFDLQKQINDAWKTLQSPILASEEFDLWITILPTKVGMTPLLSDGEIIKSTIMVQTYTNALIGEKPEIKQPVPLPAFQLLADIEESFSLHLNTDISYEKAEKIAQKYVIGQTYSFGKRSVKVEGLKLYGTGDQFVLETDLTGSFKGNIRLTGRPVFDREKNEIEIKSLEYQLETKSLLIRVFNWLFQRRIKKTLKKYSRIQLSEKLNELMITAEKELENFEIAENVFLNGKLCKLEIKNLQLNDKGLEVSITSTGKINLFIKKIDLRKESEI
jgi:Domain of unknown function (DUF4403)